VKHSQIFHTTGYCSCPLFTLLDTAVVHCLHYWILQLSIVYTIGYCSCPLFTLLDTAVVHCLHYWILQLSIVYTTGYCSCPLFTLLDTAVVHCLHYWILQLSIVYKEHKNNCVKIHTKIDAILRLVTSYLLLNSHHFLNILQLILYKYSKPLRKACLFNYRTVTE